MLGFIVPFRSKAFSNNWEYHSALVNRTISSLCNQIDQNFTVFVVYSDYPQNVVNHKKVIYLHFPFPHLKANEITDLHRFVSNYYVDDYVQNEMDQARRIIFGCKFAIEQRCDYLMSVDADDLVSNQMSGFVNQNSLLKPPGWYVNKGYVYLEGRRVIYRYPKHLNHFCASTNIVRADLVSIPDFSSKNLLDYNFFSSHAWLETRLKEYKKAIIKPLPFKSVIYVLNSASWTNYGRKYRGKSLKKWAKLLIFGQFINKRLTEEFKLTKIDERLWK